MHAGEVLNKQAEWRGKARNRQHAVAAGAREFRTLTKQLLYAPRRFTRHEGRGSSASYGVRRSGRGK